MHKHTLFSHPVFKKRQFILQNQSVGWSVCTLHLVFCALTANAQAEPAELRLKRTSVIGRKWRGRVQEHGNQTNHVGLS